MIHPSDRYSRQSLFPQIGEDGQRKYEKATIAIIGLGGIGSVTAEILTRAGIGTLLLVDRDVVEVSNLQRQTLYTEKDAKNKAAKAVAAEQHLMQINSSINIKSTVADVTSENIEDLIAGADIVLDALDNFETRYLLNKFCVRKGLPWVYASAVGSYGVVAPIVPKRTHCLYCLIGEAPRGNYRPTCHTAGIIAPAVWTVSCLQAIWAMRLLLDPDISDLMMTTIELWTMRFYTFNHLLHESDSGTGKGGCPICQA